MSLHQKNVLLLEEADVMRLLAQMLSAQGAHVAKAINSADAIQRATSFPPDLLVMNLLIGLSGEDLELPHQAQLDLIKRGQDERCQLISVFQSDPILQRTMIVVVSQCDDLKERCLKLGAKRFIRKPISLTHLVLKLSQTSQLLSLA